MGRLGFLTLQEFLNTLITAEKSKPGIDRMNYVQPNHFKSEVIKIIFIFLYRKKIRLIWNMGELQYV